MFATRLRSNGVLVAWRARRSTKKDNTDSSIADIRLENVSLIFGGYVVAIIAAFIVLLFEIIYFKFVAAKF